MQEANVTGEAELDIFHSSDSLFLILCSCLVLCLHVGLILLRIDPAKESTLHTSLAAKATFNFFTSALVFYYIGYVFAHGQPANGFIGYGSTVVSGAVQNGSVTKTGSNLDEMAECLFRIMMATTTSVIVLSVIADRTNTVAATVPTLFLIGFIYPIIVHWCWSDHGWLKSGVGTGLHYQDHAGAGVIHVTGATAAFVANYFYRVDESQIIIDETISPNVGEILSGVGYFATFIGFLGLNCGAQLHIADVRDGEAVAMIAINTVLSSAICGVCITIVVPIIDRKRTNSFRRTLNGGICGMVAAAAGANNIYPWFAFIIGLTSAVSYILIRGLFKAFKKTDPEDVVAIHFGGGVAGTVLSPILSYRSNSKSLNEDLMDNSDISSYLGVLWNFFGVFIIFLWTALLSTLLFWASAKLRKYQFFLSKERLDVSMSSFESIQMQEKNGKSFLSGNSSEVSSIAEGRPKKWKHRSVSSTSVKNSEIEEMEHETRERHQKQRVMSWIYHQIEDSDSKSDTLGHLPSSNSNIVLSQQTSLDKVTDVRHVNSSEVVNYSTKPNTTKHKSKKTAAPRRQSTQKSTPKKAPKSSSEGTSSNMFQKGEYSKVVHHAANNQPEIMISGLSDAADYSHHPVDSDHHNNYNTNYLSVPKATHKKLVKQRTQSSGGGALHQVHPRKHRRKSLLEKTLLQNAALKASQITSYTEGIEELELQDRFRF